MNHRSSVVRDSPNQLEEESPVATALAAANFDFFSRLSSAKINKVWTRYLK